MALPLAGGAPSDGAGTLGVGSAGRASAGMRAVIAAGADPPARVAVWAASCCW